MSNNTGEPSIYSTGTFTNNTIQASPNSGYVLTTGTGSPTSAVTWAVMTTTTINDTHIEPSGITVHGDAEIDGNLTIKGIALNDRLDRIEEMLKLPPVLRNNKQLEQKYKELEEAAEAYKELEQKYITWENMKKEV